MLWEQICSPIYVRDGQDMVHDSAEVPLIGHVRLS